MHNYSYVEGNTSKQYTFTSCLKLLPPEDGK